MLINGFFFSPPFTATGGTISTSGAYTVHSFTSVGTSTFTVNSGQKTVNLLVVPGGGGHGSTAGGSIVGGGAPGDYKQVTLTLSPGTYTVEVGAGGGAGANGSQSKFDTTIASGGLHGSAEGVAGQSGVFGSGAGNAVFVGPDWTYYNGGTGTKYSGGNDFNNGAGGGAGASANGGNAGANTGGNGGAGVTITVGAANKVVCAGGPGAGLTTDGTVPSCDYGRGGYYAYQTVGSVNAQQGAVFVWY